jgi:hypothetical protein
MKRGDLSRKHFLSLSAWGGLAWLGVNCGGGSSPKGGTGGSGGAAGSGGAGTGGAGSGGNAGTGGSAGSGGGGGSAGSPVDSAPEASPADASLPDTSPPDTSRALDGTPISGATCTRDITVAIFMNHTNGAHSLVIPLADVTAGVQKVYNARGAANHDHFLAVTAADFVALQAGQAVTKFACNGGDHQFILSCGTPPAGVAPNCVNDANMCGLTATTLCM